MSFPVSFMSVRSWAILGAVCAVSLLAWNGYRSIFNSGVSYCEGMAAKELVAHVTRAQEQARQMALQDAEVLQSGTDYREVLRNVYRTREIEIVKQIPADCSSCRITPAGIQLLNDALSNAPTTANPSNPRSESNPLPRPPIQNQGGNSGRGFRDLDSSGRKVL